MKKITEELLKDAFIDLIDNGWLLRLNKTIYVVHKDGNGESGNTISQALKSFTNTNKAEEAKCNKLITISINKPNNDILNFREYKEFQQDFLGSLSSFCDEIEVDEDKVTVENGFGSEQTITIIQDEFNIKNIVKFTNICRIFNIKYDGKISIGLYDDGIKLNMPSDVKGIATNGWYQFKREALEMISKDFDIIEKDFSLYLHPKFEFIENENI